MKLVKATNSYKANKGRNHRGFTLVELIVVLVILSILAAIGVTSVVGYINKSRYDQNEQNAITLYQTAQTAISQKISNGTIYLWVKNMPGFDSDDPDLVIPTNAETNYSAHKIYSLTYNPDTPEGAADKYLYDLLSPYFYDRSFFAGTMAVEFDICAVMDNNSITYSASVRSAFYCLQNDSKSGGWDATCLGTSTDNLPNRDGTYRYRTSHVGYFNGTEETIAPLTLSPVIVPWTPDAEIEGHIQGPTINGEEATGYLFNLRNGETLDVSWAVFDYDGQMHEDHFDSLTVTDSENNTTTQDFAIKIKLWECTISNGLALSPIDPDDMSSSSPLVTITIDSSMLSGIVYDEDTATEVYESIGSNDITRSTCSYFVQANVQIGTATKTLNLPISITRVHGDGRIGTARDRSAIPEGENIYPPADYYEYSISLDCIMTRDRDDTSSLNADNNRRDFYNIERFFGDKNPRNICATIEGNARYYDYNRDSGSAVINTLTIPMTYAARAINDPVYLTGFNTVVDQNGDSDSICGNYNVQPHKGRYDGEDNTDSAFVVTGMCVVNTLFGDKVYKIDQTSGNAVYLGGTALINDQVDAVLTSCRHLYNIRWISGAADFKIVSNLDWYVHRDDLYYSEVKVFSKGGGFESPVMNDSSSLRTVSFPAIKELKAGQTLRSMSVANGTIYSINNIQMRAASFQNDTVRGLICTNNGIISNVYTNNLNLILADVPDGTVGEYSSINDVAIGYSATAGYGNKATGGLVGLNKGSVGSSADSVVMSNTVVMAGQYWTCNSNYTVGIGGVIGLDQGSSAGVIETNGAFVVLGGNNVGGVTGLVQTNVGARIVVNGTNPLGSSEFDFSSSPYNNGQEISCAVIGIWHLGGAIGKVDGNRAFTASVSPYSFSTTDTSTGAITFGQLNSSDYQIDVTLPGNSLILGLHVMGSDVRAVGGAIGHFKYGNGEYINIRVNNSGNILTNRGGVTSDNIDHCGGVIGYCELTFNTHVGKIFIDVNNGTGSSIGSYSATDSENSPLRTGGAIGYLASNSVSHDSEDSIGTTIAINAVNDGLIVSRGNGHNRGSGGAIGGASDKTCLNYIIRVVNNTGSRIVGLGDDVSNANGVGGAIGGMGDTNDNSYITSNSIIYVENSGTLSGRYHVGGAIGSAPTNYGKIYAVNSGNIAGESFVGGTVGRQLKNQYGTIQSVLNGATISGVDFVGGAAGRISNFRNYIPDGSTQNVSSIKTIVRGNSIVECSGSIAGGVCGDINVADTNCTSTFALVGDSASATLTVRGTGNNSSAIGGAAGVLRANLENMLTVKMPTQSDTDRLILNISGKDFIGGAVGRLRSSNKGDNTVSSVIGDGAATFDILVDIRVILWPGTRITGTNNVGGAVGLADTKDKYFGGSVSVSSAYGASSAPIEISGVRNVGGAFGQIYQASPRYYDEDSGLNVDFSLYPVYISGSSSERMGSNFDSSANGSKGANIGGAIGYIEGNSVVTRDNNFPIEVLLGTSQITAPGSNVGGAIGNNYNSLATVDINVTLNVYGLVQGGSNVGGAIGLNYCNSGKGEIHSIEATINGRVEGTESTNGLNDTIKDDEIGVAVNNHRGCVGGAVGFNFARVYSVSSTLNGAYIDDVYYGVVTSAANNVGGSIGFCYSNAKDYLVTYITAELRGQARVQGMNNVGGAVGHNLCNIGAITSQITGSSKVMGINRVGGALGFACTQKQVGGRNVLDGTETGRVLRIVAVISADYALQGASRMGGAVGQVGYKDKNSDAYRSPALVYVEAQLDSAYLFDPDNTRSTAYDSDACIGGVVGIFVDGRLGMQATKNLPAGFSNNDYGVVLSGSGGNVHLDYPDRYYQNTVLIAAYGRSIGGIIGEIGIPNKQQNCCVSNISADGGPGICVVSLPDSNGRTSDRIGGWIGSSYAQRGGIGSEDVSKPVTYNVNNVRVVISQNGSEIGGFCGRIDSQNGDKNESDTGTYARINVNLRDANIIGQSAVGGVFGKAYCCRLVSGWIDVSLNSYTNIGDYAGNPVPGDTGNYEPRCYDAGGAIGYVESTGRVSLIKIPISVTIDNTSRVYAGAVAPANEANNYGVGGIIGRFYGKTDGDNQYFRVACDDPYRQVVGSRSTNVGGAVGIMFGGNNPLSNCYVLVSIRAEGDTSYAGGIVGRMTAGTLSNCHYGAGYFGKKFREDNTDLYYYIDGYTVTAAMAAGSTAVANSARVGGVVGNMEGGTVSSCYTTAIVNSVGAYTGGFVGCASAGSISNSYTSGHTYQGYYVSGQGNVSGVNNVGGFAGATTGAVTISNCYTTASVLGTGSNVGGFIGSRANNSTINKNYCTGLVTGSDLATTGLFAGVSSTSGYGTGDNKNKVMSSVNDGTLRLIGSSESDESVTGIVYAAGTVTEESGEKINDGNNYNGHRSGSSTTETFPLRAVINNEHWGDWPLPVSGQDQSIANALIYINGELYDPSNPPSFPYNKNDSDYLNGIVEIEVQGARLSPEQFNEAFTVTYQGNDRVTNNAVATIAAVPGKGYSGARSISFIITAVSLDNATAILNSTDDEGHDIPFVVYGGVRIYEYEYTGVPIVPFNTVTLSDNTVLVQNTDYYLTYERSNSSDVTDHKNISETDAAGNFTQIITVTAHGRGNYEGSVVASQKFVIVGRDIADATVTLTGATAEQLVYTGNPIQPGVIVRIDGGTLKNGRDYTVTYDESIHAGEHTITIEGIGSFRGTYLATYTITQATNQWETEPSIDNWVYDETPSEPIAGVAKFGTKTGEATISIRYYSNASCEEQYLVDDITNADVGTYYMLYEVKAPTEEGRIPDYTDLSKICEFRILPATLNGATVTITFAEGHDNHSDGSTSIVPDKSEITVVSATGHTVALDNFEFTPVGDTVNPGEVVVNITGAANGNYTGTATGTYTILPPKCHVTFNPNGGTIDGSTDPQVVLVENGDKVSALTVMRDGYLFLGWFEEGSTQAFNFDTDITSDVNLTAEWKILWTVTFVTGDGTYIEPVPVPDGELVSQPADDPELEGYTFGGWYQDEDCTAPFSFNEMTITEDTNIYAKWTINKYTVTFYNGSEVYDTYENVEWNTTISAPENPDPVEGYTFGGWYTDSECTEGNEFDFDTTGITTDTPLYAKWTINTYTVTFYSEGEVYMTIEGVEHGSYITAPEPTREGYTFGGWYQEEGCVNPFYFDTMSIVSNTEVYALWNEVTPTPDPDDPDPDNPDPDNPDPDAGN